MNVCRCGKSAAIKKYYPRYNVVVYMCARRMCPATRKYFRTLTATVKP